MVTLSQAMSCGTTGASEEVLKARELSRETIEQSVNAGQGRLHTDFASMHAAIMAKACSGNRCPAWILWLWYTGLTQIASFLHSALSYFIA